MAPRRSQPNPSHIPEGSVFFDKVIPILLIGMGVLTVAIILIAAGILLGIVPFK